MTTIKRQQWKLATMTGLVERVDCSLAMAMDSVTQDTQGVSPWDDNVDRK